MNLCVVLRPPLGLKFDAVIITLAALNLLSIEGPSALSQFLKPFPKLQRGSLKLKHIIVSSSTSTLTFVQPSLQFRALDYNGLMVHGFQTLLLIGLLKPTTAQNLIVVILELNLPTLAGKATPCYRIR